MQDTQVPSLGQEVPLEKGMSTPVFLPVEFQGQRSLVGYCPWGHKQSDMTEQLTLSFSVVIKRRWTFGCFYYCFKFSTDNASHYCLYPEWTAPSILYSRQ